jgi:hypothetical protein
MRHTPVGGSRIAEEAALLFIPEAAIAHLFKGIANHLQGFGAALLSEKK